MPHSYHNERSLGTGCVATEVTSEDRVQGRARQTSLILRALHEDNAEYRGLHPDAFGLGELPQQHRAHGPHDGVCILGAQEKSLIQETDRNHRLGTPLNQGMRAVAQVILMMHAS
jgi:hypothetical protein